MENQDNNPAPLSTFSVVSTPIGNLEDITLRALRVLREADLVLCEDTRMTKRLLERHAISTPTMSYHMHSKLAKIETILGLLAQGKKLALVSDAGTPGISDPGSLLVSKIRERYAREIEMGEIKIEAVPGPSALVAALSIAGLPVDDFIFLGFFPHKKGRETLFKEIAISKRAVIFYESPHRIMKTLESLALHTTSSAESVSTGAAEQPRQVTIVRELTKIYEQVVTGSASELVTYFTKNADKVRGEFVVIVAGAK